ncbi:hypothetical protein [Thiorhodococcus minor]|uniref:Uncharacterized protein n=1 Tax=Thiorhodococcus minor TaxID=57489 RepID=A0A6M0K6B7_9GAMM|nr:hypothetical protein [Thiorhodococcus minor]NEV65318.1 hypothetical protein [Thiorhodococcus minor]
MATNISATRKTCLILGSSFFLYASTTFSDPSSENGCEAALTWVASDYIACLSDAHARDLTDGSDDPGAYRLDAEACDYDYIARYFEAVTQATDACPGAEASWDGIINHMKLLQDNSRNTVDEVALLNTKAAASSMDGKIVFVNNCDIELKLMSPDLGTVNGNRIKPGKSDALPISQLHTNQPNVIMVAPVTTTVECERISCENWIDVQPNSVQREPSMWQGTENTLYAAYCQPTNAAAKQCSQDAETTPCCGPSMVYDNTFGTHFEITPNTPTGNDFINLSTNSRPPDLCNGSNPDNCVEPSANIFYNVPIQITISGSSCDCGPILGERNRFECLDVDCKDAYTYPTDPKQCACTSHTSSNVRAYTVTYCPSQADQLPEIPMPWT